MRFFGDPHPTELLTTGSGEGSFICYLWFPCHGKQVIAKSSRSCWRSPSSTKAPLCSRLHPLSVLLRHLAQPAWPSQTPPNNPSWTQNSHGVDLPHSPIPLRCSFPHSLAGSPTAPTAAQAGGPHVHGSLHVALPPAGFQEPLAFCALLVSAKMPLPGCSHLPVPLIHSFVLLSTCHIDAGCDLWEVICQTPAGFRSSFLLQIPLLETAYHQLNGFTSHPQSFSPRPIPCSLTFACFLFTGHELLHAGIIFRAWKDLVGGATALNATGK